MKTVTNTLKGWFVWATHFIQREFPGAARLPRTRMGRILFAILLLLGIFFHSAGLGWGISRTVPHGPAHHDEPRMVADVVESWKEYKENFGDVEVYLSVYFFRFFARPVVLVGQELGWDNPSNEVFKYAVPRAVSSVFGILGLLAMYLLGTKLGGTKVGLFSLGFLAVMPGHWYYSQLIKGDIIVTTLITLLLLAAIFIAERGSRFSYIFGGVLLGMACASKVSIFPIVPIIFLAHGIYAFKQRSWRRFFSFDAGLALLVAAGVFLVLYPYPYANYQLWKSFITSHDHFVFHPQWVPTPNSFMDTWRNYNGPVRPFMDMVFGKPLHYIFPIAAAWFVLLTTFAWKTTQRLSYILTFVTAFILYHSFSFFEPQGDRYLLTLTPFVALFAALFFAPMLSVFHPKKSYVIFAESIGGIMFLATLYITWAFFPQFALQKDVREVTVDFVQERLQQGDTVGEFEPRGRQSLPFDPGRATLIRLRTPGEDGHIAPPVDPTYVVVPVEPWNYDQAFRYQLFTPTLRSEFDDFLKSYQQIARFGKEPVVFEERLPRGLYSPIYDVYQRVIK